MIQHEINNNNNGIPLLTLFKNRVSLIRPHVWPFLVTVGLLLAFYWASTNFKPGWLTYSISSIAMVIIALTALARVNDITIEQISLRWSVRRIGLIMVGAAAVAITCEPLIILSMPNVPWKDAMKDFPSWREVMIRWGFALVWITTPHMPPWAKYITGRYATLEEAKMADLSHIVTGILPEKPGDVGTQYVKGLPLRNAIDRRSGQDRRKAT